MADFTAGYDDAYFKTARNPGPLTGLAEGQVVEYTKYHLKSIGCGPTHPLWRAKGRVTEIVAEGAFKGWPRVLWLGREEPVLVSPVALCFPGANRRRLE